MDKFWSTYVRRSSWKLRQVTLESFSQCNLRFLPIARTVLRGDIRSYAAQMCFIARFLLLKPLSGFFWAPFFCTHVCLRPVYTFLYFFTVSLSGLSSLVFSFTFLLVFVVSNLLNSDSQYLSAEPRGSRAYFFRAKTRCARHRHRDTLLCVIYWVPLSLSSESSWQCAISCSLTGENIPDRTWKLGTFNNSF